MAESSNSLTRVEFKIEVADFLGYTRDSANWSSGQEARVEACVDNGYRMFLSPPKLSEQIQRGEHAHEWSFLKPWTTLSINEDEWYADAPDDFADFAVPKVYYNASTLNDPIDIVPPAYIYQKRQLGTSSGRPTVLGIRPKASTGNTGQRYEIVWWPTANADYTVNYAYYVLQGKMTAGNPYPLGGAAHGMTILAACLAWADETYKGGQYGKRTQFTERLRFSVDHDMRFGWHTVGSLVDDSDGRPVRTPSTNIRIYVEGAEIT